MNLSFAAQARGARVGNLYGWALGFLTEGSQGEQPTLLLTSDDYHAKIAAALPTGLNGGRFNVVIDALTDEHYRQVRACKAAALYLYWQDVNADFLGYAAGISGLAGLGGGPSAASLAPALVTRFAYSVRRRVGPKTYETVLDGRDNAFDRLSGRPAPRACFASMAAALSAIGAAAGVEVTAQPNSETLLGQALELDDERTDASTEGQTCAGALETIANRIAAGALINPEIPQLREGAPSVVLLRQGAVHVGRRPIPFPAGSEPKTLDFEAGLVEAAREGQAGEEALERWGLLCRGRPDIQPGDVVKFKAPAEDIEQSGPGLGMALAGALLGPVAGAIAGMAAEATDRTLVVTGVVHTLSRTGGFTTQINGVRVPETPGANPWEPFHSGAGEARPARRSGGGDPATAVGRQVRDLARAVLGRLRLLQVAEIRSAVSSGGSPPEPPARTVTVWEGVGGETAQASPSRRLPIRRRDPIERRGVATVTPFAWGACGLAVPRYPGMRVMLGFGGGNPQDAVELGALWGPGERMETEPGDWWLKLPVDQNTDALSDEADHLPSGKAVNDLTDKTGVRVIEVGKLTIRVGPPPDIGGRPTHKADATVSIEHADGEASITIDSGGAIRITGKTIDFDASGGTVSIAAKDFDVSVSNRMTVGD